MPRRLPFRALAALLRLMERSLYVRKEVAQALDRYALGQTTPDILAGNLESSWCYLLTGSFILD